MTDLPTPAAEKAGLDHIGDVNGMIAGLDAKGLEAALIEEFGPDIYNQTDDVQERSRERLCRLVSAYLEATPDAQYRRGAEDMREAAAKRIPTSSNVSTEWMRNAIRALPLTDSSNEGTS